MEKPGFRIAKYDEDLAGMNAQVLELLHATRTALRLSVECLSDRDIEKAEWVIRDDEFIDHLEMLVDRSAADLIMRYQPIARDLRQILAAMRVSSDLERIGDNARSIAKRVVALSSRPRLATRRIALLGSLVVDRFDRLVKAYESRDAVNADEILENDCEIDEAYLAASADIVAMMENDPTQVRAGVVLLSIAKSMERIGDRLTNIAEQILFEVDGKSEFAERPRVPSY